LVVIPEGDLLLYLLLPLYLPLHLPLPSQLPVPLVVIPEGDLLLYLPLSLHLPVPKSVSSCKSALSVCHPYTPATPSVNLS
jgi:hypothetical protein